MTRRRRGRPQGAKDKVGGRYTEGTRRAVALIAIQAAAPETLRPTIGAIVRKQQGFAKPERGRQGAISNDPVKERLVQNEEEHVSQRRRVWRVAPRSDVSALSQPGQHVLLKRRLERQPLLPVHRCHAGYDELLVAADAELPEPPICTGCSELPFWRLHFHCVVCGAPYESPLRPARRITLDFRFEFVDWLCGKCLPPAHADHADHAEWRRSEREKNLTDPSVEMGNPCAPGMALLVRFAAAFRCIAGGLLTAEQDKQNPALMAWVAAGHGGPR